MAENQEVGMRCIKYMIFITNFIFMMIGFLIVTIGSTISTVYADFEHFMELHHFQPAYLMIAIGVIIFFISIFGCFGTFMQSVLLINIYVFLLLVLLILEVGAVIAAFSMHSNIYDKVESNMLDSLDDYSKNANGRDSWDFVQERLRCCGVHQMHDWWNKNVSESDGILVPGLPGQNNPFIIPKSCSDYFSTELLINERGCLDRVCYILKEGAVMIGVGGLCVVIVQILLAVFAYTLGKIVRHIKTNEEMDRQEARQRIFDQLVSRKSEKRPAQPLNCDALSTEA